MMFKTLSFRDSKCLIKCHLGPFADDVLIMRVYEVLARKLHGLVCHTRGYNNPGFDNIAKSTKSNYRNQARAKLFD